jgi:hypothetical protein
MRTSLVFGLAALGIAVAPAHGHSQDRVPASCPAGSGTVGSLSGTVLDVASEVPLRDAKVILTWSGAPPPRRRPEQRTDAIGGFRFCDVPAGSRARVRVEYLDNAEIGEVVTIVAGQEAPVTVRVKAAHVAVQGRVIEEGTGAPIADATLRIDGSPLARTSDAAGRFNFDGLPAGEYRVHAEHLAYTSLTDSLSVDLGTNVTVEVRMATNAIPLDPIVVDARSLMLERRGFYMRKDRGLGTFLTRDRIDRVMPLQPSDVLRGVAGIRMERRRGGFGYAPVGRAGCGFRYFVDGARIGPGFEIDDVPVEWIEALEVYHGISTVPAEFAPVMHEQRGTCGLIVIWTKNRA